MRQGSTGRRHRFGLEESPFHRRSLRNSSSPIRYICPELPFSRQRPASHFRALTGLDSKQVLAPGSQR